MPALYALFKKLVGIAFNVLNFLLGGNLPPFTCVCVLVEEQDRYLIIERPNGDIVFPGGFMRWREHPKVTARREGKEETGLLLAIGDLVSYHVHVSEGVSKMSTVTLFYTAEVEDGVLQGGIEGKPAWMDEGALRSQVDWHYLRILDDYLAYRAHGIAIQMTRPPSRS